MRTLLAMMAVALAVAGWEQFGAHSGWSWGAERTQKKARPPSWETLRDRYRKIALDMFGAATRSGGEPDGTLEAKKPADFKVGDWGSTSTLFRPTKKISETEVLVETTDVSRPLPPSARKEILIRGLDTSKVTNGTKFVLPYSVVIVGTYSYADASGEQRTVLVLERNLDKLNQLIAAAEKAKEDEALAAKKAREADAARCPLKLLAPRMARNSLDEKELYVRVENIAPQAIVAFEVRVYCYDRFGDPVEGLLGSGNGLLLIFQEKRIAPGKTLEDSYHTLHFRELTTKVKIVMVRILFENGEAWKPKPGDEISLAFEFKAQ